jgi:hypothetical protein
VAVLGYTTVYSATTKPVAATPILTDPSNFVLSAIQILEQELQEGDLDAENREELEARLQILYAETTRQAINIQHQTTTPWITFVPPTFELQGQRATGIIQYPSVPFPSTEFRITNAWQDLVNGQYVLVFVGTRASELARCRDCNDGVAIAKPDNI